MHLYQLRMMLHFYPCKAAIVFFFTKAPALLANLLSYVRACLSPMAPWPREEECAKQGGGAQVHDHGADPLGGGHFEFLQNRRHLPRRGRRQRRRPLLSPLLHRASLQ